MAAMHVIEETPTRIVLEMDASQNGDSSRQGLGCSGLVVGITFVLIVLFMVLGYPNYNTPRSWLFWMVGFGDLIIEAFVIYLATFVSQIGRTEVEKVTVNIDLQSRQASRFEKLRSGKVHRAELDLNEVSRVLVCREELGQSCRVLLDSKNGSPLEVNADGFLDVEPMKLFANRLGHLLEKPVVMKKAQGTDTISGEPIHIEAKFAKENAVSVSAQE